MASGDAKRPRDASDNRARKASNNAQIIEALRNSGGIVSVAAASLRVSRQTLHVRISSEPEIKAAIDEIRNEVIDLAEGQLLKAIRDGSEKSIHFYLRTIGKMRGYSERVVVSGDPDQPVNVKATFDLAGFTTGALERLERDIAERAAASGARESGGSEGDTEGTG